MIRFVCCRYRKFWGNTRAMSNDQYNFLHHDYHNDKKIAVAKKVFTINVKLGPKGQLTLNIPVPFISM